MSDLLAREMTATGLWLDKKCFWCGKYFKLNEKIVLIVPESKYKQLFKRLSSNVVMHSDEYEELKKQYITEHELLTVLGMSKPKRVSEEITEEQIKKAEAFKKACWAYDYKIETRTKGEMKMRRSGTSHVLVYNLRTDRISYNYRGKRSLFDGLYTNQIVANVYNKMQEVLGTNLRSNYNASEIISNAVEKVNKMFE